MVKLALMLEDYNWQLTWSRYSHGPGLSSNWSFCWVENCLVKGSAKPKSKTIALRHSANASHCWVFCAARLNSETFFAKFNHFKLAHILHSRRTLQAWFFNGQMPTGNKTWKMWARLLCLIAPPGECVASINDCQTLHWTTKSVEGVGPRGQTRLQLTVGQAFCFSN